MATYILSNGDRVEGLSLDEVVALSRKLSRKRAPADEPQAVPGAADELNQALRAAGVVPEDLGTGDPEVDALNAALVLVGNDVPLRTPKGKAPPIRIAVATIFGARSQLAIQTAVTDNKRLFSRNGKHQSAKLTLTPSGRKKLTALKRGKISKKAVGLAAEQISR